MPKAVPVMKRSNALPLRTAQAIASGTPGAERSAKITLQHVTEPAEIAQPDRLIEPHIVAQRLHLFRRRLIAKDHIGEIARQKRSNQECQQRHGEQNRHQIEQPSGDESQHGNYSIQTFETSITPLYILGRPFSFALETA
jgi:hypothetical protein